MFIVATIVFVVARLVGNPESFLLPYEATDSEIETIREHLGLNDSLIVQYGDFPLGSRATGLRDIVPRRGHVDDCRHR